MARRIRWGIVIDGVHHSIFDIRADADAALERELVYLVSLVNDGWLTFEQANSTRVYIERVTGNAW